MGREKAAAPSTKEAKAVAKANAEAPPAPPEPPKRKLHRIKTGVIVAKEEKVLNFGAAGASGEWICSSCGATSFASRSSCFKCKEPRETAAAAAAGGKDAGGGKGGAGGAAVAGAGAEGGIVLKEWQRLPKQLLQQYCDRAKLPRPRYTGGQGPGGVCKAAVWLNNPKDATGKSDRRFQPPDGAATAQDAQHRAALHALFGVEPSVQHQLKLPEPYRTIWLELQRAPPAVGSRAGGGSAAAAQASASHAAGGRGGDGCSGGRGGDGAGRGGRGGSGPASCGNLTLSESGRDAAHRAILEARAMLKARGGPAGSQLAGPGAADGADAGSAFDSLASQLRKLGFGSAAAMSGARHACSAQGADAAGKPGIGAERRMRDAAIDWLCLSLPEDELPVAFQVKRRVQIVRPPWSWAANGEADALTGQAGHSSVGGEGGLSAAEEDDAGGTGASDCEVSRALAGGPAALLVLLESISAQEGLSEESEGESPPTKEAVNEELAALESIFGVDRFSTSAHDEIQPGLLSVRVSVEGLSPAGALVLLLRAGYPSKPALPVFEPMVEGALSPAEQRLLCGVLARQAARLAAEGAAAVYELCCSLQDCVAEARMAAVEAEAAIEEDPGDNDGEEVAGAPDAPETAGSGASAPSRVAGRGRGDKRGRGRGGRDTGAWRRPDAATVRQQSEALLRLQHDLESDPRHADMRASRASLPAFRSRAAVLSSLALSRVLVVCGETGCGKSTQVPQHLLEDAIHRGTGGATKVVVTQPRRIAAISLAERVAAERGRSNVGDVVGYAVRLDSRQSRSTRLLFCTTGVLLQQLKTDPTLAQVSHVVVDEVHERSVDSDFLLIVLREALAANPTLRVILMSATLDASLFADFFGGCAVLNIPGRTFPITDFTLEDVIERTGYVARGKKLLLGSEAERELEELDQARDDGAANEAPEPGADGEVGGEYSERTRQALLRLPSGAVPADLVAALLAHLDERDATGAGGGSTDGGGGAVLIFLPGVAEIRRLAADLSRLASASRWLLLPLHGELPPDQQRRVFGRPPKGLRKVVLATNVAETSLTIDDVRVVIDSGRVKLNQYDTLNATAQLVETWAALSSRRQRRGRAGRTSEGEYWALYSRAQLKRLPATTAPEMARVPLDNLYLQVKALGIARGDARAFLLRALQPPTDAAINAAETTLLRVGAIVAAPNAGAIASAVPGEPALSVRALYGLSPLGEHLARMPLDLRVGKMLLFGALLGCVDPVLTIAAAMSLSRPPFLSPMEQRAEANAARAHMCTEKSDQLALLRAYEGWSAEHNSGGAGAARRFANAHFLSANGMDELHGLRAQLASTLGAIGLPRSTAEAAGGQVAGIREMHQVNLVRSLVCAGLYPNVAKVQMPDAKFEATAQGAVESTNEDARAVKFYTLPDGAVGYKRVFLHPSSALFGAASFEQQHRFLVFHSRQQQANADRVYLRDVTAVSPLSLLLFGGEVSINHDKGSVTVDSQITFNAPGRVAVLVRELRAECDSLLRAKIEDPALDIRSHPVLVAIVNLLSNEE